MRNTLLALIAGSILCGCLSSEEPALIREKAEAYDPSGNSSPTISGNPPSAILFGELYEFKPNAADPDGDLLTFQIANRPNWASFNASTGRLSGQPTLGNIGTYAEIVITVSDGKASRSLPAFSITVAQSAQGIVTLNWSAPSRNTDGSALLDLAGYTIYYGKNSRTYDHEIRIDNPGMTTYVVNNLLPDTYYFAATSYNSLGIESDYSSEIARTVN